VCVGEACVCVCACAGVQKSAHTRERTYALAPGTVTVPALHARTVVWRVYLIGVGSGWGSIFARITCGWGQGQGQGRVLCVCVQL
jgi:hypothetical protein